MPLAHQHRHSQRDLVDSIRDMAERDITTPINDQQRYSDGQEASASQVVELVKNAAQSSDVDSTVPTVIAKPTQTTNLGTEIAVATGEAPTSSTAVLIGDQTMTSPTSAATESSTDVSSSSDSEGGISAGATAGIVFGVLGGVLLIGLFIYFAFSRRKGSRDGDGHREEKFTPVGFPPPPPMKDNSKPPRLSLRPVTQFFPNFNADRRASKGAGRALSPAGAAGAYGLSGGISPFERPGTSHSTHPSNPFGNQAERAHSPIAEEHSLQTRSSPPTPDRTTKPLPSPSTRQTSMYTDQPANFDLTLPAWGRPASPAGTEFSMSSATPESGPMAPSSGAAAIASAGGPKDTTVHRVQLDFKPSLTDEMELKAGELVRLLHEYDDGWALVIQLDRSKQGMVPRTCLSTHPVKPRQAQGDRRGPPVNPQSAPRGPYTPGPGQRPMTPQGRPESPMRPGTANGPGRASPAGFTPQSPAGRPMSPAGRPHSPGPRRQEQGRARAGSRSHGPSPMNPGRGVAGMPPGQAM